MTNKSKVAVVRTTPGTVLDDIERLMHLAGVRDSLAPGAPVILKDNISWHLPMPGANTTPWQLEGTVRSLRNAGYTNLVAVENKTVVTRPKFGERLNKFDKVYRLYDIPVKYNFEPADMSWVEYRPKAKLRVLPKVYPHGLRVPDFFIGKNIVHLPTMKCHIYTTTTGAMKNAFGGLLSTRRHYTHSWIHGTLADLLKVQKEIHPGLFAVMDGTTAGNGPGPRTLKPVQCDLLLAGSDQVAIDAAAARLMGFDPMSIGYIAMADSEGLGHGRPGDIDLVGDDVSGMNLHFRVGNNLASLVGNLLWFSPLKVFQNALFRTPLVYAFVVASDFYHDRFWWNAKGKRVFGKWKRESAWGRLWDRY